MTNNLLSGIDVLMNREKVDPTVDVNAMIKNFESQITETDNNSFLNELEQLDNKLNQDNFAEQPTQWGEDVAQHYPDSTQYTDSNFGANESSRQHNFGANESSRQHNFGANESSRQHNFGSNESSRQHNFGANDMSNQKSMESPSQPSKTQDEIKHEQIRNVMDDLGVDSNSSSNLDYGKNEDRKAGMLEEIEFLREELAIYQRTAEHALTVGQSSSFEEINAVLKIYRKKADRLKYCTFAEEFLMLGVYALEETFNGKREWFGYKPNLTGWSNVVSLKMKRFRHDTSQIVGQLMYDYDVSPFTRIMMELIPSAIIFSRTKNTETIAPRLSPSDINDASKALSDL